MKYYACNIVLKERSIHLIIFPGYSDYSESNAAIRSHFRLNLTEQRAFQIIVMYSEKIMHLKYYACNIVLKERSIHLIIFPGYSDYSKSNAAIRSHFRLNLTEQRAFQIPPMYSEKIMIWSIMPVILFWKNDLYIWSYFLDIQTILSRMPQSAVISDLIWLSSVHFKS